MDNFDVSEPKQKTKQPRFRSPPYPAIDLQKAIARVSQFYTKALHHLVPLAVPADAWGYEEKSSGLMATIAALKQFGLLIDQGSGSSRRFQLTEPALRISRDPDPRSVARLEALKKAALAPKIHAELWHLFGSDGARGNLDVAMTSHLVVGRTESGEAPFSEKAADLLIEEYKNTISFVGLDVDSAKDGEGTEEEKESLISVIDADVEGTEDDLDDNDDYGEANDVGADKDATGRAKEQTNVVEGQVTLYLPSKMSADSFAELESWFEYILRKHARRAGVEFPK